MTGRFSLLLVAMVAVAMVSRADGIRISGSFPSKGVERVVLRSAQADRAAVAYVETADPTIAVIGSAAGGADGYHSADPNWKETPASQWGMKFVAKKFGTVLVVSSQNEIGYIHHQYAIDNITVQLPKGVQLIREKRELSGSGEPDLRSP